MSGRCRPYRERSVVQAVGLWRAFVFRWFRYGRLFKGCTAFGFTVKIPPFCRSACRMAAVARTFDGRRYMRAAVAVLQPKKSCCMAPPLYIVSPMAALFEGQRRRGRGVRWGN